MTRSPFALRTWLVRLGDPRQACAWWVPCSAPLLAPVGPPWLVPLWIAVGVAPVVAARVTGQRAWPVSPFSWPIGLLLGCVVLGAIVSPEPDVSVPKLTGVLAGVLAWRALVLAGPRAGQAARVYLLVGAAVVALGLVGANIHAKFLPASVTDRFLTRVCHVPGTSTEGSVNANALGGTTLFFLPMALSLLVARRRVHTSAFESPPGVRGDDDLPGRRFTIAIALWMALVLLLSQSRSAWFGAAAVAALLLIVRWRALAAVALGVGLLVGWRVPGVFTGATQGLLTSPGSFTMEARFELWSRALFALQQFPFTGVGLNAFRRVLPWLYPPIVIQSTKDLAHAHDTFLQVGLDTGVIGLVAYVAILLIAVSLAWRLARRSSDAVGAVALGAAGA